ncbi:arylsulfatase [Colwellia sp. 12G3]|uniref:arylsulfatase n=1 Tax=Colwellia sp. 12G3 TaxID=2058299 RepID=UPI000C31B978|nr:arylsulfatase [Colwellia sp. 12G3]PKI16675.1 N-acetylgalactosamine-6-sulfatase [Colwellia sp. 12G3]
MKNFNKKNFVSIISILAFTVGIQGCSDNGNQVVLLDNKADINQTRTDKRPNIIYILADDLGYGDVGAFGQTKIKTPSLDQMAKQGMRLTQHYAGSTVCAPSRASLVTGKQPGTVQIRGNFELGTFLDEEEWGQMPLRPGTETIGTLMQKAGYETALIGKWGLGGPDSYGTPNKQGFTHFFGYLDQKQAHNHYPTHLWLNEDKFPLNNEYLDPHQFLPEGADADDPASYLPYKREDYAQQRIADDALRYIEENQHKPFFLYLSFAAPHAALQAPEEELEQYSHFAENTNGGGGQGYIPVQKPNATRAGMISHLDRSIGNVLAKLKALNLDENTLVIFSSDNGPSWEGGADLTFFDSNGDNRGYKRDLYEGGIRMPTIAWWPGKIKENTNSNHVSAFWDIMPTLADLAEVKAPAETDGISLLPTLLSRSNQQKHKHLYWEFHNNNGEHAQAIRLDIESDQWKAVRLYNKQNRIDPPIELYNLALDQTEQFNIASAHPEIIEKMKQLMIESRTQADMDAWNFDYWPKAN